MLFMEFGNKVAELRKEKGISQTELAKKLEIHKNVLGRYERNEVKPTIEIAHKIANILDVSLDFLVGKNDVEIDKMLDYTELVFDTIYYKSNEVIEQWIFNTRWGVTYDFEQLMEHAIVHVLRHGRQIVNFLKELKR